MSHLRGVAAGAVILGGGYSAWLLGGWGGNTVSEISGDAGLIFFAAFASACAALAAGGTRGKERAAWVCLSCGVFGWAVGETLRTYRDLVSGDNPFASWADAGFAAFLLGAALCLGLQLFAQPSGVQLRLGLDGVIVGAALFGAAWVTLLGPVYARAASPVATVGALAYPMVDIALITVAALLFIRAPAMKRPALAALTGGLMLIALSDAVSAYLRTVDGMERSPAIVIGWTWGFLGLGLAALLARSARTATDHRAHTPAPWLPYVPVAASAVICTPVLIGRLGPVYVAAAITVFAVMGRQLLVIADNRRLLGNVVDQARRDPLTGLANRPLFAERLSQAMRLYQRHPTPVAVLVIDLDHFRDVNDNFGHPAGDTVLVRVAERLASAVGGTDTVARFGADEFAVLTEGDAAAARGLAQTVVTAFERPFVIADQELAVRPSIGVALAPAEESDITGDQLLVQAGAAMTAAKRSASREPVFFAPDIDAHPVPPVVDDGPDSPPLLRELRHAIEHGGLCVVYQPKFDMRTYDVVGVEALVRWTHPRCGMLTPERFLPLVRQHGLMRSMTAEVFDLALDDTARWYGNGVGVPVAINVFAPAISDPELPAQITDALDRRGLPPEALTVEITEDLLLDDMGKTRIVFKHLRDKGIRVAIDDFGTGYSSLWYLREFPVDEVKLDREFIAPMLTHPASAVIVRAVVDLAHALGVTPVAEGVENTETVTRLLEYGCEVAQGYLYSAPLSASAIEKLLYAQKRRRGAMTLTAPAAARSS